MIYFRAKNDAEFIKNFRQAVISLWEREETVRSRIDPRSLVDEEEAVQNDPDYRETREWIAKSMSKAVALSRHLAVPGELTAPPPAAFGGVVIRVHVFETVLHDPTYRGVDRQTIIDMLNRTVGAADDQIKVEFQRLINPFYWIKEGLKFVLRIPFALFEATGFNVEKIEDQLWVRLFKVGEILILLYLAARFGLDLDLLK